MPYIILREQDLGVEYRYYVRKLPFTFPIGQTISFTDNKNIYHIVRILSAQYPDEKTSNPVQDITELFN